MKYKNVFSLIFVVVILFFFSISSEAYTIHGELTVRAYGGEPYDEDFTITNPSTPLYSWENDVQVIGNTADPTFWAHDNYGWGAYSTNLETGELKTFARAVTGNDVSYINSASAKSMASFSDILTFEIAPNIYDEDILLKVKGHLSGNIIRSQNQYDPTPVVKHSWDFSIGSSLGASSYNSGGSPIEYPSAIDEDFWLHIILLRAGEYESTRYVNVNFSAYMMSEASVSNHDTFNGLAEVDFFNTGEFTSIIVPEGVTWTSDSGVFLSAYSIPIPSTLFLMTFGLLWFTGISRRKRK